MHFLTLALILWVLPASLPKAVVLAPVVIRHHFFLGELYQSEDRPREALKKFQIVLSLPVLLASDRHTQRSAAEIIEGMGN